VLPGSGWRILHGKEQVMKMDQAGFHVLIAGKIQWHKSLFKRLMPLVKPSQKPYEVKGINRVERSMLEVHQRLQIPFRMMKDKFIGFIAHHGHQLPRLPDDRHPLAPRQDCCEQTSNLNILFPFILVRNRDRVMFNERPAIEPIYHGFQQVKHLIAT
jgi:hypothetical protein